MKRAETLRARLTLWYVAALSVALTAFAVLLYVWLGSTLYRHHDGELQTNSDRIARLLTDVPLNESAIAMALRGMDAAPRLLMVRDAQGELIYRSPLLQVAEPDYTTNRRRSLRVVALRVTKHLTPVFRQRRLMSITTADVRAFTARRQEAGASNATINRDLMLLKRMCVLAMQAGKLTVRPYIPLLTESNIRTGFFEPEQFQSVQDHLPAQMRGVVAFAFITGWRTPSEILPLEWRHVEMKTGEVRLDAGTTKNGEGRVFPFTSELRRVLEAQQQVAETLTRERGLIVRYVFCYTTGQKAGQRITEGGFNKAWRKARVAAGCPGRIPHDFRRTAVRNLVRAGVPERVAMQLTGHKTRAIFERYNITSPNDLREAAQRLDAYARAAR